MLHEDMAPVGVAAEHRLRGNVFPLACLPSAVGGTHRCETHKCRGFINSCVKTTGYNFLGTKGSYFWSELGF